MAEIQLLELEKLDIIKLYQDGLSYNKIAKKFNTSYYTIRDILDQNCIARKKIIKLDENEIISLYNSKISILSISKLKNCAESSIKNILKKHSIPITNHIKYFIKHDFLNKIDTSEKAYFIGFFFADGCMVKGRKSLSIKLKRTDEEILRKFNSLLCDQDMIKYVSRYRKETLTHSVMLNFNSKQIYNRLLELGCSPAKSLTLELSDYLIQELGKFFPDFMRGYVDGDGCLRTKKYKNGYRAEVGICVTEQFGEKVKKILLTNYNIVSSISKTSSAIYNLGIYGKENVRNFLDLIYRNSSIYLERKYNQYLDLLNNFKNSAEDKIKNKGKSFLKEERQQEIISLYKDGKSIKFISKKFGHKDSSISKILKFNNIEINNHLNSKTKIY
jgi:DNA-binding NarL/FixJ family response regulator